MADDGIAWLTNPQRDFLARLTTLTIQRQLGRAGRYGLVMAAVGPGGLRPQAPWR